MKNSRQTWNIGYPNEADVKATLAVSGKKGKISILTISGKGAMKDFEYKSYAATTPWHWKEDCITSVVIKPGVTNIGSWAFYGFARLTAVTIPGSVTSIGEAAFSGCRSLEAITIPDNVTHIGKWAFWFCKNLAIIKVGAANRHYRSDNEVLYNKERTELLRYPKNSKRKFAVPDGVTNIGKGAFSGNMNLEAVTIPGSVKIVGEGAFRNCAMLGRITMHSGVETIGEAVFACCKNLKTVVIPGSVTSIGEYAFSGCERLDAIAIPVGVEHIGRRAFGDCPSLAAIRVDENNAYYLSEDGVLYDKKRTQLLYYPQKREGAFAIPCGVERIEDSTFSHCEVLTAISIPDSLTCIASHAFYKCTGLTAVTIPGNVKSIGDFAFYHCDNLAAITLLDGVEEIEMAAFSFCPVRAVTIPGSVKNIRIDAFEDCHSLTAVDIDAENIGPYAFSCCSKLVKVVISDKVQSISKGAFSNCCDNLAAINVGAGNAYYLSEDGVLYDKERKILLRCPCGKQGAFAIPDGVESIAEDAFAYCKGLTAITIPGSVKSIGEEAFAGCAKLTVVAIPDGVEHIGKNMFLYCDNLTVVTIPDSVTSIAGGVFGAFENCESLTAIEVGAGNRHYLSEDGVLYNKERTQLLRCPQKKTGIFSIPQGVESIADSAFSRCNDLSTVTIPISVKNIGKRAFSYCAGLTALTIPGSVENIGEWAFNDSHRLTSITMLGVTPPIVEEIDYNLLYHISISTFPPGGREKCTLYVPAGTIKPYRAVSALKYFHIKAIE